MAHKVVIKMDNVTIEFDDDAQAKEKPPVGGNSCSGKGVLDPVLLRKAQERVDARKGKADDVTDKLCDTLDKILRSVAQDIFKPPN